MLKKTIIGRKDVGDFPEMELSNIPIKIDTGAHTSAIHCHHMEKKMEKGKAVLYFTVLDPSHKAYTGKEYTTTHFKEKSIKSSNGSSEVRYIIETFIILFEKKYNIDLSLSERGAMKFPVLIGRRFLKKKFLVNPSKYDLSFKKKIENKSKKSK